MDLISLFITAIENNKIKFSTNISASTVCLSCPKHELQHVILVHENQGLFKPYPFNLPIMVFT